MEVAVIDARHPLGLEKRCLTWMRKNGYTDDPELLVDSARDIVQDT